MMAGTFLTQAAALPAPPAGLDLASAALAPSAAWLRVWMPWLRALVSLCTSSRGAVRDAAVVALQRALLSAEVRAEPAPVWAACFECVVFPLLAELLQRAVATELRDERLMLRAVTLLSKSFLHHLAPLLSLPEGGGGPSFSVLWLRALELLQSYAEIISPPRRDHK